MKKYLFFAFLMATVLMACSLLQPGIAPAADTQAPHEAVTVAAASPETLAATGVAQKEPGAQPAGASTQIALPIIQNEATATSEPPAVQNPPVATAEPVTQPTAIPTAKPTTRPTAKPTAKPTDAGTMMVKIYLIAIGDNGVSGKMIGCGDSAVAIQVEVPHTQGVLRAALEKLLSIKDQFYGQSGLYNVLYQSDIKLDSVSIKSGKATIQLSGTLKLGGECDDPRVMAEIKSTALQFSTVSDTAIFLNGVPLEEVLSEK